MDEEYARLAATYDERWASYIAASIGLTLSRLPPEHRFERILDVGCGTGALLARLSARFPSATLLGADPSLAMLTAARSRAIGRAALVAARAEALPFPDACFDLLVSTSAMHYFADLDAAAAELYRVIAPGGALSITDWCRDFLTMRALDRVMRMRGKANFTMLRSGDCERLLRSVGFEEIVIERRRIGVLWGLMVVSARKPAALDERARRRGALRGARRSQALPYPNRCPGP
ncbi:MAG TPA: class I SAM-dependent methyltransferase [Gammaproteobacteria bacterium]